MTHNSLMQLVAAEIKSCTKTFLARIHPDRFHCHPEASNRNQEVFKFILTYGDAFSTLLSKHYEGDLRPLSFPLQLYRLRFYDNAFKQIIHDLPAENLLPNHSEHSRSSPSQSLNVSWEEVAYNLFLLVTKAGVEHDGRLTSALLEGIAEGKKLRPSFGCLFENQRTSRTLDPKDLLFKRALSICRLSKFLSADDIKVALNSIWNQKENICELATEYPELCILVSNSPITNNRKAFGFDGAGYIIQVPLLFGRSNLLSALKS